MLKKLIPLMLASFTISCGGTADAKTSTCSQKLSGTWEFGRAPYGCAISSSLAQPLEAKYPTLVYDDRQEKKSESPRFTTDMYSFLTDYSSAYLKRRSPNATDAEVDQWNRLILSVVHQESFWTHFRKGKDGLFRFFRGDGGHGYGLMQLDDRWHKQIISSKKVYDLNEHFVYALDMLYDGREQAKKKPCGSKRDTASIARSTYSAYNGGAGSRCRWTNPSSKWVRNDTNFFEKYSAQSWEKVITDGQNTQSTAQHKAGR